MSKVTVTGSFLAKLFPKSAKAFLENTSTEEFNQAEQEAAVIHQQLQGLAGDPAAVPQMPLEVPAPAAVVPPAVPAAVVPATVPTAEQLTALTTQLATANQNLAKTQNDLTAANATIASLQPKASQWDAYQASLTGVKPDENKPAGQPSATSELSDKQQARITRLQELKAKYPNLTAGMDIPDPE